MICSQTFSALADLVAWVLDQQGIRHQLYYFLFLEVPESLQGSEFLATALRVFEILGIPVAAHKTEGPTSVLVFLGILIDTQAFELHLPADKLAHVQETRARRHAQGKSWNPFLATCHMQLQLYTRLHIPEAAVSTAVSGQFNTSLYSPVAA